MKYSLLHIMMLCMLLSLTACQDDDSSSETPKVKTVLMYLPWTGAETGSTGSLYNFFNENINDIEQAIVEQGGLGSTRLLVYIAKSYTQAALVDITYKNHKCVRDTLKKYTNPDVTTETGIRTILEDAYVASPTPTYAMIIGSHATGWLPRGSTPWKPSQNAAPRRAYGGQTTATQAEVTTLAQAITHSSIGTVQYICFDDCYMCNIETAYALRHCTKYLVASTSEIMDVGIPYKKVWKYLANEPDYKSVCDEYLAFYQSYKYPYGTLSTVDCSKVEQIIPLVKSFNATSTISSEALAQVQPLDGFTSTVFYDFMDYINHSTADEAMKTDIKAVIDNIVVYTVTTPTIFSQFLNNSNHSYKVNTSSGITISDPSVNPTAIDSKKNTEWWKATH